MMHTPHRQFARRLAAMLGLVVLCMSAGTGLAEVRGRIRKAGDSRWIDGMIRWRPSSKEYGIRTDKVTVTLPLSEVGGLQISKPANLDKAIQSVNNGAFAAAIPTLEGIVNEYLMLQHDVAAGAALARAYLGVKRPKDAEAICEKVMDNKPGELLTRDLVGAHWDALLENNKAAQLREALLKAIQTGPRPVAAEAQLKRGDLDMKRNDPKGALIDGYLRTIVLFQDVKEVQAEALYKAYQCFDKLAQNGAKDRMRKQLLAEFPQSKWSQKLR